MRIAICVIAVLIGVTARGYAQNAGDNVNPRWKKIEIPTIDPNLGFTARLGADQSNIWSTPDPSSLGQSRRNWSDDDRAFGLTLSRPIQF
jgi:hypothetical protein